MPPFTGILILSFFYSHVYEATEIVLVLFQRRIHSNLILVDGEKYCGSLCQPYGPIDSSLPRPVTVEISVFKTATAQARHCGAM